MLAIENPTAVGLPRDQKRNGGTDIPSPTLMASDDECMPAWVALFQSVKATDLLAPWPELFRTPLTLYDIG